MTKKLIDRASLALGAAALLAAGVLWVEPSWFPASTASDHTDSPLVDAGPELLTDIADTYAFRSPADSTKIVVAMTVRGHDATPITGNLFDNDARYRFFVDNTIDGNPPTPDAVITVTFSGNEPNQTFKVEGLSTSAITGNVGAATTAGAVKVFCGEREDPFFFDLVGFQQFVAAPYTPTAGLRNGTAPADTFAGKNVCAIILEFPIDSVNPGGSTSGTIKAWTKTFRLTKVE